MDEEEEQKVRTELARLREERTFGRLVKEFERLMRRRDRGKEQQEKNEDEGEGKQES